MTKSPIKFFELWTETVEALTREGLLLVGMDRAGQPNPMTIGWMTAGVIWGKPILQVYVRPSRFTYSRLEEVGEFTVNVLPSLFAAALQHCGTASGRDGDKFSQTGLTPVPGRQVRAPVIEQGVIHYECRTVHKHDLDPQALAAEISQAMYPNGDFHRVYYGEVLAVYAAADAREQLARGVL